MKLLKPEWVNHNGKPLFSVDIHPDGSRVATGGQGEDAGGLIMIWNMAPIINEKFEMDNNVPKILSQMDDHTGCVNCLRWSNNGQYLASGGDDKIIIIWQMTRSSSTTVFGTGGAVVNYENWKSRHVLRGHTGDILDVAWSPDDSYVATASIDNTIMIWNAKKFPEVEHTIKKHEGLVKGVTFDPVGKYLASQSDDKSLCIWNTSDWSLVKKIAEPFKESSGTTHALRLHWSPDGQCIATAHAMNNGGPVSKIVERNGWKTIKDFVGHRKAVTVIRFNSRLLTRPDSPKSQYVCCGIGSRDRSISVWATSLKRPLVVINNLFDTTVMDISWSRCGYYMMACSLDGTAAFCEFTVKEIGKVMSDEDKFLLHKKTYGTSIKAAKSLILSTLVENPAFLKVKKQKDTSAKLLQRLATPAKNGLSSPVNKTPDAKFLGAFTSSSSSEKMNSTEILKQQKECKTKDGKRRIVPMLVEPPPDFENDFIVEPMVSTFNSASAEKGLCTPPSSANESPQISTPISSSATATAVGQFTGISSITSKKPTTTVTSTTSGTNSTTTTTTSVSIKRKAEQVEVTPKKSKKKKKEKEKLKSDVESNTPTKETEGHDHNISAPSNALFILYPRPEPRLSLQVSIPTLSKEDKKAFIEVENNLSSPGSLSYARCMVNETFSWETSLNSSVTALAANKFMVAMATEDYTLHIFSCKGSRLLPGLVVDSSISHLQCCQQFLMVITSSGYVSVWNVKEKKIHVNKENLGVILNKTGNTISNTLVNKKGQPVISLTDQSSYIFDPVLATWVILSDASDKLRMYADLGSCVKSTIPKGPLHSIQSPLNRISSSMARGLQMNSTKQQITTMSYLESQMHASISIGSAEEYHFWLLTYVRHIVQNDEESRLRDLCEDLLGPVHSSGNKKNEWQSKILTFEKRDLIKDLLPIISSNLQFQRFYSEIQQLLEVGMKR